MTFNQKNNENKKGKNNYFKGLCREVWLVMKKRKIKKKKRKPKNKLKINNLTKEKEPLATFNSCSQMIQLQKIL